MKEVKDYTATNDEEVQDRIRFCAEAMASPRIELVGIETYEDGTQAVIARIYVNHKTTG